MIGPVEYTPSALFTPSLTASVQPTPAASGGILGGIASAFGSALSFATKPQTQQAFTNIYSAVNQWRELDVRKDEMTTAQKIAAMANQWLNLGTVPSVATPAIVTGGGASPAQPGPVDTGAIGGLSPVVLLIGAVVVVMMLSKRR